MNGETLNNAGCGKLLGTGRQRVVVENVAPRIDGGRFPVKRVVGQAVTVQADVFSDGHDTVTASLLYRPAAEENWRDVPMRHLGNDRWEAAFVVETLGSWHYRVAGRIDRFETWRRYLTKRVAAEEPLGVEALIGAQLVELAAQRATGLDRIILRDMAGRIRTAEDAGLLLAAAGDASLPGLLERHCDRELITGSECLEVLAEPREALFSAWYELFPRSTGTEGNHGTFADCGELLPLIADMGFDVIYLPPIHPIGFTCRKGKNNATVAETDDPGSPWAIGAAGGGHTAIHPDLGTPVDFCDFVSRAHQLGLQVALDLAFQCSPDHPWVREHPGWFRWRPDGTVQYAENPPKKYQDIIPFDFECDQWSSLWEALRQVVRFWIGQGITIFRVDNPHTKPFPFWEWLIREIRRSNPETIFLSEAFTRPKVMYRLAKLGFSQSYTYFSWRNTKPELEAYLTELTRTEVREYFRPNFWPNTPDILPEILQFGGPRAYAIRFLLAATLSASYGIYGPPFELLVSDALPGTEEYLDSEKYQLRTWDWSSDRPLRDLIGRVNRIRRDHPALQETCNVVFCETGNDSVIGYVKRSRDGTDILLVIVSLDPFNEQTAAVRVPLGEIGIGAGSPWLVQDLLTGRRHFQHDELHRMTIPADGLPGRICRIWPRLRREDDFDYFM